jgi:hypothetical protein
MSYNRGVNFFIKFDDLDPSKQDKCIFFTKLEARCKQPCRDNARAIELHQRITGSETGDIFIDEIMEYILCNCCREGNAKHRDRIVNVGLLIPLAERWLDEILTQRQTAERSTRANSAQAFWASSSTRSTYATFATSTPSRTPNTYATFATSTPSRTPNTYATFATSTPSRDTTIGTPLTSPSNYRFGSQSSFSTSSTPWKPDASPTPAPCTSSIISNTTQAGLRYLGSQTRYSLRSREIDSPATPVSTLTALFSQVSLSEFQPHIEEPSPKDAVFWRICEPLVKRDFETGSVYIFNRASSPGHVKIGWTAVSVDARLEGWSTCGYTPNKLFSVDNIPCAQRAETLAHHELIKEWRRERMCKAKHCQVSHQEWFEVSQKRAIQVLGDWASFFKKAQPYDWYSGLLKPEWRDVVNKLDANGEKITSTKLLEHYEASTKREVAVIGRVGRWGILVEEWGQGKRSRRIEETTDKFGGNYGHPSVDTGCSRGTKETETLTRKSGIAFANGIGRNYPSPSGGTAWDWLGTQPKFTTEDWNSL